MSLDLATIGIAFETSGLEKGATALKITEQATNKTADAADKAAGACQPPTQCSGAEGRVCSSCRVKG